MNDTTSVLGNREELVKEAVSFPLDFAPGGPLGVFDKLALDPDVHEVNIPESSSQALDGVSSLGSMIPYLNLLFDNQMRNWLADLEKTPGNAYLLNNVGNACLGRGKVDEAIGYFEAAIKANSAFVSARASLAKAYVIQDRLEEALVIYRQDSLRDPKDTNVQMNLAHVYVRQRRLTEASETLDRIISLDPRNPVAHQNKGVVDLLEGKPGRAVSEFRKAVSSDTKFGSAYNGLGVSYAILRNYPKAIRALLSSQSADGSATGPTKNLAMVYQLAGDFASAARTMDVYLEKYSMDWQARNIAAFSHFRLRDYKRSLMHLEFLRNNCERLAAGRDKLSIVLNNIGVVAKHMGLVSEAEAMYRSSLAACEHPSPVTYFNLAKLCLELGRHKAAMELIDTYVALRPKDCAALILLAKYYYDHDDYAKAKELLYKSLDMDPQSTDALLLLGAIYSEVFDDYERAIEVVKQGLATDPQNQACLNNLAYSYLMKGLVRDARGIIDRLKWDGAHFTAHATKGLLRISEGDIPDGERLYNYAASLAPNEETKQLVRQKKKIEVARYWAVQGEQNRAIRLLNNAKLIKSRSQLYVGQADRLLSKIDGSTVN